LKKKIYAILLITVLLAPSSVTYMWLQYKKNMTKKQVDKNIQAGINKEKLVLLKFTEEEAETELRWEHSREFEYHHQMFDIVESKIVGDSIYYWCWWDIAETMLNNKISELGKYAFDTDAQKNNKKEHINPFLKMIYFSEFNIWHGNCPDSQEIKFFSLIDLYDSLYFPPPEPPPRSC